MTAAVRCEWQGSEKEPLNGVRRLLIPVAYPARYRGLAKG